MNYRLFICAMALTLPSYVYALSTDNAPPSDTSAAPTDQPAIQSDAPAVATVDTSTEVWNNSKFEILVVQAGAPQATVAPHNQADKSDKSYIYTVPKNFSEVAVSIKPKSATDSIKFVTITGKKGACAATTCLIVQ